MTLRGSYLHVGDDLLKYSRQCRALLFRGRVHPSDPRAVVQTLWTQEQNFASRLQTRRRPGTGNRPTGLSALSATTCRRRRHRKCLRTFRTRTRSTEDCESFDFAQLLHLSHPGIHERQLALPYRQAATPQRHDCLAAVAAAAAAVTVWQLLKPCRDWLPRTAIDCSTATRYAANVSAVVHSPTYLLPDCADL